MRKKILGATFMVATMAVAGYNVYLSQTKYEMSELALANVEALANDLDYPEDPNKETAAAIYERRVEFNYNEIDERWVNDTVVHIYLIPITEVNCYGTGKVRCAMGLYVGESVYSHSEIRK